MPAQAAYMIEKLNTAGHRAYAVGGCVRDGLLGIAPKDWDLCTSARPEEMQAIFADCHVVETGLKHGTLTVVLDHVPYEVTTFRVDGAYTDHRHPDGVTFVTDVREDLARRDFTVNAMAYHPREGVIDAFGGMDDLRRGVIRCVGDARTRFTEDALRILRALRFAATYDFTVEGETAFAAREMAHTLTGVAQERIRTEIGKMLCGRAAGKILRAFPDVLAVCLPEIAPMFGFEQHTPYHRYDVWEHTIRAVEHVPPVEALRLAMLLHDSGKPRAFTMDERGVGHAHGHQRESALLAEAALTRLRVDNATAERVLTLVKHHDMPLAEDAKMIRRRLHQFGEETLRQLIDIQRGDAYGKGTLTPGEIEAQYRATVAAVEEVLAQQPCVTLKQLAVNGRDMTGLGLRGKAIGACLDALLNDVMDERAANVREELLLRARRWMEENTGRQDA
ncbi:MAG: CCA tRNA nucleotidyltransferase [Clostridia bacterium]|nr:CCA tRNA nucleotidyltransferase [Clostridia bacterium]